MTDSWSSEDATTPTPAGVTPRRVDRHGSGAPVPEASTRRERYPWIGLAFLVVGLAAGGIGLALIAMDLDRPGAPEVDAERWWLVAGGGLAIAWSAPWFLRPRGRRRMAIALGVCTAAILAVAAVAIGSLGD